MPIKGLATDEHRLAQISRDRAVVATDRRGALPYQKLKNLLS